MLPRRLPLIVVAPQAGAEAAAWDIFGVGYRVRHWSAAPPGRALDARLSAWSLEPGVRAGVECRIVRPPATGGERPEVNLANGGDAFGEALPGGAPSCPPQVLRDLRDIAAARFADRPVRVGLNAWPAEDDLIRAHSVAGLPWVRLDFCSALFTAPDGCVLPRRSADLRIRFESLLSFWCRIEEWK